MARSSLKCRWAARYTVAMPPSPIFSSMRYSAAFVPVCRELDKHNVRGKENTKLAGMLPTPPQDQGAPHQRGAKGDELREGGGEDKYGPEKDHAGAVETEREDD